MSSSPSFPFSATESSQQPSALDLELELLRQVQLGIAAFLLMQQQQQQQQEGERRENAGQTRSNNNILQQMGAQMKQHHSSALNINDGVFQDYESLSMGASAAALSLCSPFFLQESLPFELSSASLPFAGQCQQSPIVEEKLPLELPKARPAAISPSPANSSRNPPAAATNRIRPHPSMLDKRWQFVAVVDCFAEFEKLRCLHQVSRNRTFAHGIRYSCTQKTQMRSNCPYLLVCIFEHGAGEHTPPGVGTISVYGRNEHTHKVKAIKSRPPRSVALQAKKAEREAQEKKKMIEESGEVQLISPDPEKGHQIVAEGNKESAFAVAEEQNGPIDEKEERQRNVMDWLAELSQHFSTPKDQQSMADEQ